MTTAPFRRDRAPRAKWPAHIEHLPRPGLAVRWVPPSAPVEPLDTHPIALGVAELCTQQIKRAESRLYGVLGVVAAVALGALLTWALLAWLTPCEPAGSLCALLAWPRRRAPSAPDTENDRLVQHSGEPAPWPPYPPCSANAMEAHTAEALLGIERAAYLDGVRDGRDAGFCWGVILTAIVALAAYSALVAR